MKKILSNWAPVLFYVALIYLLSSLPLVAPPGQDKFWHVVEYGILGFLTTRGVLLTWNCETKKGAIYGALLATTLGALDEFHQYFVPSRNASGYDLAADFLGASLGAALFVALGLYLFKSRKLYPKSHQKCC